MSSIVHGIFEIFQGIANTIVGIVTTIVNVVVGAVQGAINLIWGAISTLLNGLYHVAATAGDIVGHAGSFVMRKFIPSLFSLRVPFFRISTSLEVSLLQKFPSPFPL